MFHTPQARRKCKLLALAAYTLIMLLLLFQRTPGNTDNGYWEEFRQRLILTPFETITTFWNALFHGSLALKRLAFVNLVGNLLMFVPFGLLLPDLFGGFRPFHRFFLKCLGLICLVEAIQVVTLVGVMDVDDLILNMAGFSIGYGLYKILTKGDNQHEPQ